MTDRPASDRRILPVPEWPDADRRLWAQLTKPGATILDDAGAFAASRPRTRAKRQQNYAHWLQHILRVWPELIAASPVERIQPATVAAWLELLERTVAPYTRLMRAVDLMMIGRGADPARDWRFLERAVRALRRRARPSRNKEPRTRSSAELLGLGLNLICEAEAQVARTPSFAAVRHRDGLMIALLALRPLRLRNLAGLELGRTLLQVTAGWRIAISAEETKTHRAIDVAWPAELVGPLEGWLSRHRFHLLRGGDASALWLGETGRPLSDHTISVVISERTRAALGAPISPHLFRDCAATTLAIEDPAHVAAVGATLGHGSPHTAAKHYIHANTIAAGRRYQSILQARKDSLAAVSPPRRQAPRTARLARRPYHAQQSDLFATPVGATDKDTP